MNCHRVIVWIDVSEACIVRTNGDRNHESTILARHEGGAGLDLADMANSNACELAACLDYFHRVARALDVADEILVAGPSDTKLAFSSFIHKNDRALDPRILGVETIADRTGSELAVFAQLYFAAGGARRGIGA